MSGRGLCGSCRFADEVRSSRGSTFVRCGLAGARPGFEKYPPLPVLECPGHETGSGIGRKAGRAGHAAGTPPTDR